MNFTDQNNRLVSIIRKRCQKYTDLAFCTVHTQYIVHLDCHIHKFTRCVSCNFRYSIDIEVDTYSTSMQICNTSCFLLCCLNRPMLAKQNRSKCFFFQTVILVCHFFLSNFYCSIFHYSSPHAHQQSLQGHHATSTSGTIRTRCRRPLKAILKAFGNGMGRLFGAGADKFRRQEAGSSISLCIVIIIICRCRRIWNGEG